MTVADGIKLDVATVFVNVGVPDFGSVDVYVKRIDAREYTHKHDMLKVALEPDKGDGWESATVSIMRATGWVELIKLTGEVLQDVQGRDVERLAEEVVVRIGGLL